MNLRDATIDDKAELVRMAGRFLASTSYGALFPATLADIQDFVAVILMVGKIFVAETRDGRLAGMIAVIASTHLGLRVADEQAWWIEPEYRRGTLGPRLLRHMERWARAQGLTTAKMIAPADTDVGRFYERLGYRPVETAYLKMLSASDD